MKVSRVFNRFTFLLPVGPFLYCGRDRRGTFYFIYLFIYFWLHWVLVGLRRLLIAVASLVVEHGL